LIEQAISAFGQIDVLSQQCRNFNADCLVRLQTSIFEQVMQVNYPVLSIVPTMLPYLKANRGLLVAISSLCGKTAVPTHRYVASKHAMQGFDTPH